jgi:SAM-dependent methyltransferase
MFAMADMSRPCPVCLSETKNILYRQRFSLLSEGSFLKGYDVVVCQKCGFGFADQIPEQSAFDLYYRDMSKYEYQERDGKESAHDEERFEETATLIRQFLPSRQAVILDIGCSTGGLLSKIKQSGFPNLIGVDPSPLCASAALEIYGIRVLNRPINKLSALAQLVDFVILVGVLEHLRDLGTALEEIHKIITDNGQLYIEVPDVSAFIDVPDAPFQQFSLEHINFFSVHSLSNLMMTTGFRLTYSQHLVRRQSHNTVMPVVAAVFKKQPGGRGFLVVDKETEKSLVDYIQASTAIDGRICQIIDGIVESGRSIFVWGVGTHTLRLTETSRLSQANIRAFVDSNVHYQNKELLGVPVISPADLKGKPDPILISSRVFQQEIKWQIRNVLQLKNELITL